MGLQTDQRLTKIVLLLVLPIHKCDLNVGGGDEVSVSSTIVNIKCFCSIGYYWHALCYGISFSIQLNAFYKGGNTISFSADLSQYTYKREAV